MKPWQADRLFINRGGRSSNGDGFNVTLGGFTPLYGEQLGDLGMEARSSHRSQGMGGTRRQPTYSSSFVHVDHAGPSVPQNLFDGIDLTLGRFTKLSGGNALIAARVADLDKLIQQARAALSPYDAEKALPPLIQGLGIVRQLRQQFEIPNIPPAAHDQALFLLSQKEQDFANAINLAGGVQFTAYADSGEIVPGTTFNVTIAGNVRSKALIQPGVPQIHAPRGWTVQQANAGASAGNGRIEVSYKVTVPPDAPVSQPYWLVLPRNKEVFTVAPSPFVGDAVDPALMIAREIGRAHV